VGASVAPSRKWWRPGSVRLVWGWGVKCLELFAGAGGAALGLEAAGFDHLALVERDPDACAVLRAAGLGPVVEADVRDLDTIQSVVGPSCDLLWSSFPCQAFSTAGKRLGASDDRNGWPWTVDAIDRFKPRWMLGENVRGLLCHSSEGHPDPMKCPRCYLDAVILPQLRERFAHAGYWLLDAADYGVPQHRRRVFLWAGPAPLQAPRATHGDPGKARQGDLFGPGVLPWVSMGEALGLSSCEQVIGGGTNASGDRRSFRDLTDEPSTTVAAVQIGNAGPWVCATTGDHSDGRPRGLKPAAPSNGTKGTAYLLRPAPTVTAQEVKGTRASAASGWTFRGGPDRASDVLAMATGRRRLTVEECALLQDFPAEHPWEAARTKTSRYRCAGNAVPPTLARVVGERLMEVVGA